MAFSVPSRLSFGSGPVVQSCSHFTNASSAAMLSCTMSSSVTTGNIIIGIITCEGCSINAVPITNDSQGSTYHLFHTNCCGGTAAAEITTMTAANISSSGTLSVSAQIQDTTNRSFWSMSAYEITGATNNITKYVVAYGSSVGGQSNVNVASTSWTSTSTIIFEGADVNGFTPTCTSGAFTTGVTSSDNAHCYSTSYAQSNSPSTFTMGAGGTSFGEQVLIVPFTAGIVTQTVFSTVTGWNVLGAQTSFNWFLMVITLMIFPAITWTVLKWFGQGRTAIVFPTLLALFVGALMGTIVSYNAMQPFVPLGMTVFYASILGLYVIKGRSRGETMIET